MRQLGKGPRGTPAEAPAEAPAIEGMLAEELKGKSKFFTEVSSCVDHQ